MNPKVSICIPTYNCSDVVRETIDSVLSQTLSDLEVIVVDDGSTDDTQAVVEGIEDGRVSYYRKENGGVSSARNLGLSKASGEYTAFLDHDDLWPDDFIEVMINRLQKSQNYGLAYCNITLKYADGREIKSYKASEAKSGLLTSDLFKRGFIWTSATLIRTSALKDCRYDESLKESYEDGDFFLRLSKNTQILFVSNVEAIRREHESNLSSAVGTQPTRILVLERFYYRLGGKKLIPAKIARRRLSHACRKVAKDQKSAGHRKAALFLYKRAIRYWPFDFRLCLDLFEALLLDNKKDPEPDWQMPHPLKNITRQKL